MKGKVLKASTAMAVMLGAGAVAVSPLIQEPLQAEAATSGYLGKYYTFERSHTVYKPSKSNPEYANFYTTGQKYKAIEYVSTSKGNMVKILIDDNFYGKTYYYLLMKDFTLDTHY